jgi:predicted kinase
VEARRTPIVIVTGPPASGKTTLARAVAEGTRLPLLAKDALKEILYDVLGAGDVAWSRRLGLATYPLLYHVAESQVHAGRSFVLEANFASSEATDELRRLDERAPFRALQLVCGGDADVLVSRYLARAAGRHRGHLDAQRVGEVREAIRLQVELDVPGDVVRVDTTDWASVDVRALVERARRWLAG